MYKYDNQNDKLYEGWPKKTRDVFKGETDDDVIPDNLDTVFFDLRDKNLYFFKNDMVCIAKIIITLITPEDTHLTEISYQ